MASKLLRETLAAASAEAACFGGEVTYDRRGKHNILILKEGIKSTRMGFSGTPRSGENMKNWIRQQIRLMHKRLNNG